MWLLKCSVVKCRTLSRHHYKLYLHINIMYIFLRVLRPYKSYKYKYLELSLRLLNIIYLHCDTVQCAKCYLQIITEICDV